MAKLKIDGKSDVPKQYGVYATCSMCTQTGLRSRIGVIIKPNGVQIWCDMHNINIAFVTAIDSDPTA